MSGFTKCISAVLLMLCCLPAAAHKPSDSYLSLNREPDRLAGRWDIALRDLDSVLDLDRNRDDRIDWGEVRTRRDEIDRYAITRLLVSNGAPCPLHVTDHAIDHHSDGTYLVLSLAAACSGEGALTIDYSALFDVDAQHRGLLRLEAAGGAVLSAVLSREQPRQTFEPGGASRWQAFLGYVRDGIVHIAIGYDHILFLIALLLPAVLGRDGRTWRPVPRLSVAAGTVFKIVTAFTLAHSVTLSLATLGIVQLPSRLSNRSSRCQCC